MNYKKRLIECFHKLLTTQFTVAHNNEYGNEEVRDSIIAIRGIIENCVVIPIEKIEKMSVNSSREEIMVGIKTTRFKKNFSAITEFTVESDDLRMMKGYDINEKLLKELIFFLEKDVEEE